MIGEIISLHGKPVHYDVNMVLVTNFHGNLQIMEYIFHVNFSSLFLLSIGLA